MDNLQYFSDLPPKFDWVEHKSPFPLALTYVRIISTFERQQPIEAVWAVRDAWEVAIKFCACVSVADFLQANPDQAVAEKVAAGLLSDRGVAIGGWKDALILTLPDPAATGRRLPALRDVFRKHGGSRTTAHFQATEGFTTWRNDVFGHGVFKQDRPWYADQAAEWAKKLCDLYEALRPVFAGWVLTARTADGQTVDWSGCEFEPKRDRHQHDPLGHALLLFLVNAGTELSFGPLLSVQRCKECDHPAAFFFDRQKSADETVLLEYFAGAKGKKREWAELDALKRWLPAEFKWERRLYDTGELLEGIPILFRDFDREYLRPAYLLDAIGKRLDATQKGYVLLDGPEGTGKSYLARGLAEKETDLGLKVLAYYVRPGDLSHFASFLIELNRQVHDKLLPADKRTFEPQAKGAKTAGELQAEFVDYFTTVLAGRPGAILVIDGLDELPDSDPTTPLITDLLPNAAKLPPNLHIVLTARGGELKPRADARWHALSADALRLTLDPTSADNRALVSEYLERQNTTAVAEILARSGGVFLYAWHFVAALRQGVFAGTADLPPAKHFYPAFLDRIRQRVGDTLFDSVYLKLLMLLTAARVPVTREQIERWGIPADRLTTALNDLRDFVRQLRHRDWHEGLSNDPEPRYKIAHEAFVRFAEAHEAERLKEAHRTIATVALRHNKTEWKDLDPAEDADLYDVRFVLWHCDVAGMTVEAKVLRSDESLAMGMWRPASQLELHSRHQLAVDLFGQCIVLYRSLVDCGRTELVFDLVSVLNNFGVALSGLRHLEEALACNDEAIRIIRTLLSEMDQVPDMASHNDNIIIHGKLYDKVHNHFANSLINALVGKGNRLKELGRLQEAMPCYDEAIAIHSALNNGDQSDRANELLLAQKGKGETFQLMGRLHEAVGCYDEAIASLRRLVENGQTELTTDLSYALVSKGLALDEMGQLHEAVACYDEAISILRQLVENGRKELASRLAQALINQGNALTRSSLFPEAVACYDEAIVSLRQLVESGRTELTDSLASALVNRGNAHDDVGQWPEAIACYDKGIAILRMMVNSGRGELANTLAKSLMNKGIALVHMGEERDVTVCFDEVIRLYFQLFQNGQPQILPYLLRGVHSRIYVAITQTDWPTAASVLGLGLQAFIAKQRASEITPLDQQQLNSLLDSVVRLSAEQREQLLTAASHGLAEFLRTLFGSIPPLE
ncbi:MAG: tetratricopeptide repeat protein [Zavarzinella sp.]